MELVQMKHYEAYRYRLPPWPPANGQPSKSGWQEPEDGSRIVSVLTEGGSLVVVYEMPDDSQCVDPIRWFSRAVKEEVAT
jgi:hypothetical protein